ncbi:uncharacterized protein PGTG_01324 [Puccinia graminis f. sp. tritici CRL 75-36-700-3]|uniref:Uncharacterized protein n=1 Tax=Puccinia graminis f. sp. tritici (strain CRL 75-36-700-3 / race SCCL) TaxID=418459 RepID=E3JVB8_PUCGT|nr:uncharacterized protein PGTG_01324 [Puccinia graminis f. sp. tritici CRL 75-36-700-3]EFP75993.1 hypothetical protein PGTG_01324 [Puccinia graminis f. sp. tritici CRL 75-36-700-3]
MMESDWARSEASFIAQIFSTRCSARRRQAYVPLVPEDFSASNLSLLVMEGSVDSEQLQYKVSSPPGLDQPS